MNITISGTRILSGGIQVPPVTAANILKANGFSRVEPFLDLYHDQTLSLNDSLIIKV